MVWRFLKHYGMSKASDVLNEFTSTVVAFDPEVASKAQIEMMEAELHKLGRRLAEAEAEVRREHQETAELRRTNEEYLEAAWMLEAKMKEAENKNERMEIKSSLNQMIARLEKLKLELIREEQEDREVEAWRSELRRSFEDLGEKLRRSKGELRTARRQMDMTRLRMERAREQERRSQEAAGMISSISALSVALDSMNQETAKMRADTETSQLKAGLFQAEPREIDPNIAAALDEARGKRETQLRSPAERLSALGGPSDRSRLTAAS